MIVQPSERPCYHFCHCYCRRRHQHRHKPPRERQKPVSGCRGLCLFASFSVGGEARCGEIDWGRTCPSPAHTHTRTHKSCRERKLQIRQPALQRRERRRERRERKDKLSQTRLLPPLKSASPLSIPFLPSSAAISLSPATPPPLPLA